MPVPMSLYRSTARATPGMAGKSTPLTELKLLVFETKKLEKYVAS